MVIDLHRHQALRIRVRAIAQPFHVRRIQRQPHIESRAAKRVRLDNLPCPLQKAYFLGHGIMVRHGHPFPHLLQRQPHSQHGADSIAIRAAMGA